MKKHTTVVQSLLVFTLCMCILCGRYSAYGQDLRWLRVGQLQSFFVDYGSENEFTPFNTDFFSWPAQYGDNQTTCRAKGLWMGARNFYDPVELKVKSVKVIGSGPRYDPNNQPNMIFSKSIKLIGRTPPPVITVDGQFASVNREYDLLDEVDPNLPCDRIVVIHFNTSIGVSVTKKVLAFTQQNHENYFIHDYVIKNTGIYNSAGDIFHQTLTDFWVHFNYRNAFAGVTSTGFGSNWGSFSSEWGSSSEYHDFGPSYRPYATSDSIRGFYSYYGPNKDRVTVTYDQDWGCPNQNGGGPGLDGLLGSAKYAGAVTLCASKSPQDWSDDLDQPRSTSYFTSDDNIMSGNVSQYDEVFMQQRYNRMSEGHLTQSHAESVGNQYVADWRMIHSERDFGGGSSQGQGFGPYTLAPGDSIHIVFAEGVSGISWEKCQEVGANWYAYYTTTGTPTLIKPDGSVTTNYTDYTKSWVRSGIDSIIQTYKNARSNYRSGYNIPQAPPAPNNFTVESGDNRIHLTWADNANSWPHFDGYSIYRSQGSVKDYRTVYKKIFECNKSNVVHSFDDITAERGLGYFYYIQSKDDGSTNDIHPGAPLASSKFYTMTSIPTSSGTDVESNLYGIPKEFKLRQNYPNPFNPSTNISFDIPLRSFVSLKIFDLMGKEIMILVSEELPAGNYKRHWDAQSLSSGIYFYRMQAGSFTETKKLVLLK